MRASDGEIQQQERSAGEPPHRLSRSDAAIESVGETRVVLPATPGARCGPPPVR
jgi:hypothetical protein